MIVNTDINFEELDYQLNQLFTFPYKKILVDGSLSNLLLLFFYVRHLFKK